MNAYQQIQSVPLGWTHTLPAHWKLERLKLLLSERKESNNPIKTTEILSLTNTRGIIPYAQKGNIGNKSKEHLKDYHLAYPDDLVINSMNVVIGSVGISQYFGAISPVYYALVSRGLINIKYCEYIFRLSIFEETLKGLGNGILDIRKRIPMAKLNNVLLPVPPRPEQDQIVRFLDWKVSSINKLISLKKKQIALLHERQSVHISHIVTHGLHDSIVTKNFGIKWIGDIPEHWQTTRCKYLFSERDERSKEGTEQHLSMSQKYGLVPDSQLDEHRMLSESYVGGKLCYKDDLVLNRLKAHLGVFALAPQSGVISPDYTVLMPNTERILPSFAETVLKSDRCRGELRIRVRGIIEGFWRLYTDDFNTIVLPVPPLDEQVEIMKYIVEFRGKAKKYENMLTQEISGLQELKTRLISDVVTGKIDVRDIEVPDFEYVQETGDSSDEDNKDMGDASEDGEE